MSHPTHRSFATRSLNRRVLLQGLGGGALALAGVGALAAPRRTNAIAQELSPVSLALDWYPNANHAGIFMAIERGYFTEAGLDVEVVTPVDPTMVLQTVGAGRDTFGIGNQNNVLQARSQDVPVVSVAALVQHPLNCLMVRADSDVESPADLAGGTVGIAGFPSDEAFLSTMLREEGLSLDDIETIQVGFDLMPALISGGVDAVIGVFWTHEPILAEREGTPVRYLRVEEHGVPDFYQLVMVTDEETVADRDETVRGMLGAMRRGYEAAMDDLDTALDLLMTESPELVREVEREGLDLLAPVWTSDGEVAFGTQTRERWESYATWAKDEGIVDADVDEHAAFRDDLFPEEEFATPES